MNSSPPRHDDSAGSRPPTAVRAAVGLWWAVAVLLVLRAALSFGGFDLLRRQWIEQRGATPAEAASVVQAQLLMNLALAVVLALAYAALAWMMWKRRGWARTAVTVLAVLQLVMVLATGALSVPNLITLVLMVAAWACSWRASSSEWVAGER